MRSRLSAALAATMVAATLSTGVLGLSAAQAAPAGPTDATQVPHYFGPNPNWALSPLTQSTATVTVEAPATIGGVQATATASVDPVTGGVTGIEVIDPGSGYTGAPAVTIDTAPGSTASGATATAAISTSGGVTAYTPVAEGSGYSSFAVSVSGGGGSGATAQASGGVDAVQLTDAGAGYTMPVVEFALPDLPDGVQATGHVEQADLAADGSIIKVTVDQPGSGYLSAPEVVVHNGTVYDPISGATPAAATTTLKVVSVTPDAIGSGYTSAPTVTITDPTGTGAGADYTATIAVGAVTGITVDTPGSGYLTKGIKKFQDELPMVCNPGTDGTGCPTSGKYIPLGVPEAKTYNGVAADEYVIGLVQYRTQFNTDLPPTLARGYVQLSTTAVPGRQVPVVNEMLDGSTQPVLVDGQPVTSVTPPQWLGPTIAATKDKPVRIIFRNLLPKGVSGDLFLPTDATMMGSGMGPMEMAMPADEGTVMDGVRNPDCTQAGKGDNGMCFKDNRATLHLHGGTTPWISDGTPHQWITPAGESTDWPQGVSVRDVPDMPDACGTGHLDNATDGCQTFYYTNQQSARLMFYHDHAWGITRLNVYAGEAAGYLITDDTEKKLVTDGTIPGAADTIPLVVQDRTFVPDDSQLYDVKDANGNVTSYGQDPTWDKARWGGKGSFWYHHVYMPAQNPGDPSGMSAYGRWMYGPWFWPPAANTQHGPIDNPYYDPTCKLDVPSTWQYQTDPFCEPQQMPGTPNISAGMEQFNDTPTVNGVAYPTVTLQPKSYRLRMLNAANDRFFNFQWYVADDDPANNGAAGTEVRLNPTELAAAQTDPNVFPTPAATTKSGASAAGPDWVQIGSEGGFLPAPTVIDGQQPTTWITDPTRFDVGNVDKHSMLLAPAERSDVIVDFSQFAGKTLILYNDAPAAFPARVPSYDYYTGAPDLSPNGAPGVLPGYGPNTRTVMQVKIAGTPASSFNLTKLQNAFKHTLSGTGVFESGQHPIIVGQSAYNSAYGSTFAASGNCSVGTLNKCDGFVRINDTSTFKFNTLRSQSTKVSMPLQPKAIHDEMNSTTFDPFGRMQANLGVEAQPPNPGAQNVTLYPYINPGTEFIDGTNLPSAQIKVTPISSMSDGTQIWRITHNGVDTHPIHFHLFDVQLINRVTWDNIIIPNDPNELGWKDTVRIAPLEDTIVALRPVTPKVPFEVPNSVRPLSPMDPTGANPLMGSFPTDPQGNPTNPIQNKLVNFGWEYVYHCHILSHEEMDMMRPVSYVLPPIKASAVTTALGADGKIVVSWNDNSITETSFRVERTAATNDPATGPWTLVGTSDSPLDVKNTRTGDPDAAQVGGVVPKRSLVDTAADPATQYIYRVVALNTVGYGGQFPSMTAQSVSDPSNASALPAPTNLVAKAGTNPVPSVDLTWTNATTAASGVVVERSTDSGATWTVLTTTPLAATATSYNDATAPADGTLLSYRVAAVDGAGTPSYSTTATIRLLTAPAGLTVTPQAGPALKLDWTDVTGENAYVVQRSTNGGTTWTTIAGNEPADTVTFTDTTVMRGTTYTYRVGAAFRSTPAQPTDTTAYSTTVTHAVINAPATVAAAQASPTSVTLTWTNPAPAGSTLLVRRSADGGATWTMLTTDPLAGGTTTFTDTTVDTGVDYSYQVGGVDGADTAWSASVGVGLVAAPTALTATPAAPQGADPTKDGVVTLAWTANPTHVTGFVVQQSTDGGATWTAAGGTLAVGTATTTVTGLTRGAQYDFRVGAVGANGTAFSTATPYTVVATPTNLAAVVNFGPQVVLTWNDNASNETGYVVQRSVGAGAWTTLTTVPASPTPYTYTDTTAVAGTTYNYRVAAINGLDITYSTPISQAVLAAPNNAAARLQAAPTRVRVTFTDRAANETGYLLQRSTDGLTFTTVATRGTVGGTGTLVGLTDSAPVLGTTYTYRVQVLNASGVAYSNLVTITVAVPVAPSGVAGSATSTGATTESLQVTWTDLNNESGYTIQWSTNGTTVSGSATVGADVTTYTRSAAKRIWWVRVRGNSALGNGPYSAWVQVPAAP